MCAPRSGDTNCGGESGNSGVRWRERRLLNAGFDATLARTLASDPAIDLHELIELTERGCPADLALRILAPLEQK